MREVGEITVHDENGKAPRVAFVVTQKRVEHYDDVVEYMIRAEVARCQEQDKFTPTPAQVQFLRKELIRYMVIRRDLATAQKLRIRKGSILNEEHRLDSRVELHKQDLHVSSIHAAKA
jgi:hypothetical protein